MSRRLFSPEDSDATGWISICDLYLLFAAVLLALGLSLAGSNYRLNADATADKGRLELALSTVRRLEPRAAELEEMVRTMTEELGTAIARRTAAESILNVYGSADPEAFMQDVARMRVELTAKEDRLRSMTQEAEELERAAKIDEDTIATLESRVQILEQRSQLLEVLTQSLESQNQGLNGIIEEATRLRVEIQTRESELRDAMQEVDRLGRARVQDLKTIESREATVLALEKETQTLERENKRLTEVAGEAKRIIPLENQIASLEEEIANLLAENRQIATLASTVSTSIAKLREQSQSLEDEIGLSKNRVRELEKEAQASESQIRELETKIAAVSNANARFELQEQDRLAREGDVRQELLGLTGEMGNAVFLMDRSQTMGESGRWAEAVSTLKTWLQHLPVQNAAVIAFGGGQLEAFPSRDYARRSAGEFTSVLAELDGLETGGATNTHEAIEQAFRYDDLDAVILFTDGRPDGKYGAKDVLELVENLREFRPNVKLHVIGVGDYFDGPMKRFLLGLREAGGGKFIGQ